MSFGDTTLTVVGNLTADPDLRYTTGGHAVAAFTVAASRRVFDRDTGQWREADTLFLRCSAWRDLADHVAASLTRGSFVIVTGRLKQRDYETNEGQKRTVYEVGVEDVGASLRYATAKVAKAARDRAPHPADTATAPAATSGWGTPAQPATTGVPASDPVLTDRPPF